MLIETRGRIDTPGVRIDTRGRIDGQGPLHIPNTAQECWVCRPASRCRSKESKHLGLEGPLRVRTISWSILALFGRFWLGILLLFEVFQTCENLQFATLRCENLEFATLRCENLEFGL